MPETKVDIPLGLWRAAINNWQVRCMQKNVRPPFEWALVLEYDDQKQRIELDKNYEHTATFDFHVIALNDLLTGKRDWTSFLHSDEASYEYDGTDEQFEELKVALEYFHV